MNMNKSNNYSVAEYANDDGPKHHTNGGYSQAESHHSLPVRQDTIINLMTKKGSKGNQTRRNKENVLTKAS